MTKKQINVLVIDDDEVDRMLIKNVLRKSMFEVSIENADEGPVALDLVLEKHFDCIFLDYNLPGMNGLDVLKALRDKGILVPILMLTGFGGEQLAVDLMKAGASDYIVKDTIKTDLVEKCLNNAFRVYQAEEQVRNYRQHLEELVDERTAELRAAQARLVEASHRAGMAEVAVDVLHGIGNVLNSVKVANNIIQNTMDHSKLNRLERLSKLLAENEDNLGEFFQNDQRSAAVPSYLNEIVKILRREQSSIQEQAKELNSYINFIEDIVSSQQHYTQWVKGIVEKVSPEVLVDDALKVIISNLEDQNITFKRNFEKGPQITTETHKVEQILIHLMTNAVAAVEGMDGAEMTLSIAYADDIVVIEVEDNGEGIPEENLAKIFNHGFTTRSDGYGFGLHSSANLARELGGKISAFSDGSGQGATFTFCLPIEREDQ